MNAPYQLFFLKNVAHFPDGTLFELENQLYNHAQISGASNEKRQEIADWEYTTQGYLLPDRGDGVRDLIPTEKVVLCPPFSENISPLKGEIEITKARTKSIRFPEYPTPSHTPVGIFGKNHIQILHNLHYQRIVVDVLHKNFQVAQIVVFNKAKQIEVENYLSPHLNRQDYRWTVNCEFGHLPFGFYEIQVQFTNGWCYSIDLIKHYPDYLRERFYQLTAQPMPSRKPASFTPLQEIGFDLIKMGIQVLTSTNMGVDDEILNEALALTTEWGPNFQKPIFERLQAKYPWIDEILAEKLQKYCKEAEYYMYELGNKELNGEISESDMIPLAQTKYPWVSTKHWYRLRNIAMYYARR